MIFGINTTRDISKLSQITYNNFETSLVVFMSNITTNHAISYTNSTLECLYVRKAVWFADNATGAGSLGELKKWWGVLNESEPSLGYFPNAKKVPDYCGARERRGSEGSFWSNYQLISPFRVTSI